MKYEWRYDPQTKAGYLKLSDKKIDSTVVAVDGHVMLDKDKDGEIVGVEILLKDTSLSKEEAYQIAGDFVSTWLPECVAMDMGNAQAELVRIISQAKAEEKEKLMKLIDKLTVEARHEDYCDGNCEEMGCTFPAQMTRNRLLLEIEKALSTNTPKV